MAAALERMAVLGVVTNLSRLRAILAHPAFRAGELHTGFLDEHLKEPSPASCPPLEAVAAAAAVLHITAPSGRGATPGAGAAAPDPWSTLGAWRMGGA
jgi:acetyl/propionyl-CoA carboxylase alpha subunit